MRSKNTSNTPPKKTPDTPPKRTQNDTPSTSQPKDGSQKETSKKQDAATKEIKKPHTSFSIENELDKVKISIPLIELSNKNAYKSQVIKSLKIGEGTNMANLANDRLELLFGPEVEGKSQDGSAPPFYIRLNIHDKIIHNALLDFGASHNIMPRAIMEKLGLDVTGIYKDLYSFDSSKIRCLALIKYLCVTLVQILAKSLVMDIVVAGIPAKYGMLLSRSRGEKLQGTLQMDMTYATILVFGQPRRLHTETLMKYMVSSQDKPNNYPLYSVHSDMDSFILYNNECVENEVSPLEAKISNT